MDAPLPWKYTLEDKRSTGERYASYWNAFFFIISDLGLVANKRKLNFL